MATSASFHPVSGPLSQPQPPSASSPEVGGPHFCTLALASWPSGKKWWTGSVGTGIGRTRGAVVSPTGMRRKRRGSSLAASCSLDGSPDGTTGKEGGGGGKTGGSPGSNYVVPLGRASSGITRPLGEILRDLNKRVPSNIVDPRYRSIPWYHANRLLSFYAPGWCGKVIDVHFSKNGSVTVVYRVTIRGSDGEAHRESTGTVYSSYDREVDPVMAAEELAFCRACARFGLGLHLYHDDKNM